jgi:hypothetical protein
MQLAEETADLYWRAPCKETGQLITGPAATPLQERPMKYAVCCFVLVSSALIGCKTASPGSSLASEPATAASADDRHIFDRLAGAYALADQDGNPRIDDVDAMFRPSPFAGREAELSSAAYIVRDGNTLRLSLQAASMTIGNSFTPTSAAKEDVYTITRQDMGGRSATVIERSVDEDFAAGLVVGNRHTMYQYKDYSGASAISLYGLYKTGLKSFAADGWRYTHRNTFQIELTERGFVYHEIRDQAGLPTDDGWRFEFVRIGTASLENGRVMLRNATP